MRLTPRILALGCALAAALPADTRAAPSFTEAAIFTSGQGGYNTYRIPAIVRTNAGTLLAFCEGRKTSSADSGDIDIVLRRSTDNGQTWGALTLVQEEGDTASITIGNPAPVVDESTGHIHLLFCRNNSRVFHTMSTDNGLTWSVRDEITAAVKPGTWSWYATGPVHGIQLKRGAQAGRLVVPCDHTLTTGGTFGVQSVYSDDHGATWQLGAVAGVTATVSPNENTCVEMVTPAAGGGSRLHFNTRDHTGSITRATTGSNDGGTSYAPADFTDAPQFTCPTVQGALLRFRATDQGDPANRILFSCPNGSSRNRISVWSSNDEALTWSAPKAVHEGPSAYSDMAVTGDGKVALLYEKGTSSPYETITLARFNEEWLDAPPPPAENPGAAFWNFEETAPGQTCSTASGAIRDVHPAENGLHQTATLAFPAVAGAPAFGNGRALAFTANGGTRILDSESGNRFDFAANQSFTLEIVCRIPAGSTQVGALVAKDLAALSPSWWLRVESGKARFLVADTSAEPNVFSTTTINDGQWHHIAAVRDATNPTSKQLRLYIDGQTSGSAADTTSSSLANGQALWIGRYNAGTRLLTGEVDLVRITPAALVPAQFVSAWSQFDADGDKIPDDFERAGNGSLATLGSGDADGDGRSDLMEFALGTNPAAADAPAVTSTRTGTQMRIQTPQRILPAWLSLQLHSSHDLMIWSPVTSSMSLDPLGNGLYMRTDLVELSNTPPGRMFYHYVLTTSP